MPQTNLLQMFEKALTPNFERNAVQTNHKNEKNKHHAMQLITFQQCHLLLRQHENQCFLFSLSIQQSATISRSVNTILGSSNKSSPDILSACRW